MNRWCAMNAFTNSNWFKFMPEEDLLILDKIKNTTVEEAFKILMPYLENKYENNKELIDSTAKEIKTILDLQKDEVFKVLEKLTKHPIEYKEIKIRLTTLNRCPYTWETWEILMVAPKRWDKKEFWTSTLAHEMLHMQTHRYYESEYPMNQLNKKQFNLIKESLTFLLNHEFEGIEMRKDPWYENHQKFRKVLEDYRLSLWENKDFEKLIEYGCNYILDNKILEEK